MKKYKHPIDGYFRENLKDHQITPSDAGKMAFLSDAMQIPRPDKKRRTGIILFSASLIALIGTGIVLLWSVNSYKSSPISTNVSKPSVNKSLTLTQQSRPGISTPVTGKQKHVSVRSQPENVLISSFTFTKKSEPKLVAALKSVTPEKTGVQSNIVNGEKTDAGTIRQKPNSDSLIPYGVAMMSDQRTVKSADSGNSVSIIKPDTISISDTLQYKKIIKSTEKDGRWIPNVGLYYTPEWMFNTVEGTKFVNNLGIEGTFHFGRFSVRTGAGLSIAKGTNELTIEYNDFLGAYNKLDSMKFAWSDPSHQYIPTYYMTRQDVWDSLLKLDYPKVIKRYTYIQIPLIMGYDFWQTEKFSLGIRVGPVMSVLLTSKQLSEEYDPGTKRVVSMNDVTPGQVNLNWQITGGLNASIHLTRNLILEIEPCGRYYFNSVYEKPINNTKPWSLGIRTAVVVSLN